MQNLSYDLKGRVERLKLSPSSHNSLLPLYEAFSNSIYAIRDVFGENAPSQGKISIKIIRDDSSNLIGFNIEDNGIGFDEKNYASFLQVDSARKIGMGRKGAGRLTWMKVFKNIHVKSFYKEAGEYKKREFDFVLENENQVRNDAEDINGEGNNASKTIISLKKFCDGYAEKCPKDTKKIVKHLIGHFLPLFVTGECPNTIITDLGENSYDIDVREYFKRNVKDEQAKNITLNIKSQNHDLTIAHMKISSDMRPREANIGSHFIFLSAHNRSVSKKSIDDKIGIKKPLDGEYVYACLVSGKFLDDHVNQERTEFTFDADIKSIIYQKVTEEAEIYLADHIQSLKQTLKKNLEKVFEKEPSLRGAIGNVEEFTKTLHLSQANDIEAIHLACKKADIQKQTEQEEIKEQIEVGVKTKTLFGDKLDKIKKKYQKNLTEHAKGKLADYVMKRKAILDLLQIFQESSYDKHEREKRIHSLICPMNTTSENIDVNDHNLWIIDDRLAFSDFFASDKRLDKYTDLESQREPDLTFFYDSCLAWKQDKTNVNKVVLVEFKKPGRDDYDGNKNPVRQILNYVELLKTSETVKNKKGTVTNTINKNTTFDCYVIADITKSLRENIKGFGFETTPDEMGRFAYTRDPKAYVEIIPFEKLIKNANERNRAFFEKLGLRTN